MCDENECSSAAASCVTKVLMDSFRSTSAHIWRGAVDSCRVTVSYSNYSAVVRSGLYLTILTNKGS